MPNMFVASDLGDPKLKQIGLRVANSVLLAAEKVVAHDVDAAKYRLPAEPGSMEQILHSRFKSLRESKQKMAAIRVMSFVKAPPQARAAKYQDLVNVDLENDRSVANQVRDLAFPATLKLPGGSSYVSSMAFHGHILPVAALSPLLPFPFPSPFPFPGIPPVEPPSPPSPPEAVSKLELRIRTVRCVDETGGWPEWGADEIRLGGTAVDESGDTEKIPDFKVGDFDDGDVKDYNPPKSLITFDLNEGTDWPKSYFVSLVLAEEDMGGTAEFLNKLLESVREQVIAALSAAIGAAIGASGGPVGALIGAVVGFVVGKVFEWFSKWWGDDIFPPVTVSVEVAALNDRWAGQTTSPQNVVGFKGHDGRYTVAYDWRLKS